MKKLTLNLDELSVVSFEATKKAEEDGTVKAQEEEQFSYPWSCGNTCNDTLCGQTYCRTSPCAC